MQCYLTRPTWLTRQYRITLVWALQQWEWQHDLYNWTFSAWHRSRGPTQEGAVSGLRTEAPAADQGSTPAANQQAEGTLLSRPHRDSAILSRRHDGDTLRQPEAAHLVEQQPSHPQSSLGVSSSRNLPCGLLSQNFPDPPLWKRRSWKSLQGVTGGFGVNRLT